MGDVISLTRQHPGLEPVQLDYRYVARAKRLMRGGMDLHETAVALGVRSRDLDYTLWRHIGAEGWAS